MSQTVLDGIVVAARRATDYNPDVGVAPVALLWTDEGRQWEPVVDELGQQLPVVTLGDYDVERRRGSAYWIRCVVGRTIDVGLGSDPVVVYLPGVSRSELRAADTCAPSLAPIAELQYRSRWFSHPNSRDWTVRSLLSHRELGLGLRVADDAATTRALTLALAPLLDEPLQRLTNVHLDADYLLELVNDDPVLSMLAWLDDPLTYAERVGTARWTAFVQQSKAEYGLDPTTDGELTAARRLGERKNAWKKVWKRFAETPGRYAGVVDQLRKARPAQLIVDDRDAWPQENEQAEDALRAALEKVGNETPEAARTAIGRLAEDHSWQRGTVWADLGQAPLAFALEHLAVLAEVTAHPLSGGTVEELLADYRERGWRADDAVVRALAEAPSVADRSAVASATAAMYVRWLDNGAKALQQAIGPLANAGTYAATGSVSPAKGTVVVFVDGLRLDLARRLEAALGTGQLDVTCEVGLAALPTVTETAKAALAPVSDGSLVAGSDFHPARASSGARGTTAVLRALMEEVGVRALGAAEVGDPSGRAWTEVGAVDHRGHDVGLRLADHVDEEVKGIAARVRDLVEAGWQRVDIVTDHGWLLVPGAMLKVDLPASTVEIKKGRCARLKDGASVAVPTVPWHWDAHVRVAVAPGATCFEANKEYEHGGVSPQECFVPRLVVRAGALSTTSAPVIADITWHGLRCNIELDGVHGDVLVDLRRTPADATSTIAEQAKGASQPGKVSLLVWDDDLEGDPAYLVVARPDGALLAQREVVVGSNR